MYLQTMAKRHRIKQKATDYKTIPGDLKVKT